MRRALRVAGRVAIADAVETLMTLWLMFAVMTAAAMFAVIWPLTSRAGAPRSGSDIAVYRDQLEELERDLAGGIIREREAQAARIEISRRLLAASDAAQALPADSDSPAPRRPAAVLAAALALPLVAAGLYGWVGSPELAFEQSAQNDSRAPDESVESLVARAEAHLARNPDDGQGWEILAPVYVRLDRYADAVSAWENVLRILGENAARNANLGEALTMEANGVVTADAKAAFLRALTLDGTSVSARYYLGLAAEQDGERDKAAGMWRDLLAEAPPGAFWIGGVREALARVEGGASSSPRPASQTSAAAARPPEQDAMIHSMVDRLAARLKQDGSDVDGWVRLVRSYKVLGDAEKARAAMADARQALAGDPGGLGRLNAALKELDSSSTASLAPAPRPATPQMSPPGGPLPSAQDGMIQSMVDRLAARLKQDGSDVDGWVRLVRSYNVLGDAEKARAAVADARRALAGDPDRLKKFEGGLQELAATNVGTAAEPAAALNAAQVPLTAGAPPAHDQGAMIQGMVQRLAERLKTSGSDPEGWLMLVRSYEVLGDKDKAAAAVHDARDALAGDRGKLEQFNAALGKNQRQP
jgi:cytochrome c-type biogenesis protein CcmH